ncbi:uncharacterized protein A4U43_C08F22750 [Asparagus officinalis]|nr:uncharacterized protein A4U43_C08F22750 [Asparagus officinalis]
MADIYEARRRKIIDENIARMRALGISPLSQTFFKTLPMLERKSKGGCKSKNIIPSTSIPERRILVATNQPPQCTHSEPPHPEPSSIAKPDHLESPQTIGRIVGSVPSARRNVRGATRGKGIERLVRQLGHAILVRIPSSSRIPKGEHATFLANEIGKEIRSSAPVCNCG